MEKNRAWAQTAVDVEDIDLAIKIGRMALEEGADWIEVGTPLIYKYGNHAIGMMRDALGKEAKIIADYKFIFPMGIAEAAAAEGADYAIFEAGYQIQLVEMTLDVCKKVGLTPVFYLTVHPQDYTQYADLFAQMGAEYFFSHHYYEVLDKVTGKMVKVNNAESFMACKEKVKFCITNDDFDSAKESIRAGADWITFGRAIRTPDRAACRKWIEMIHSVR